VTNSSGANYLCAGALPREETIEPILQVQTLSVRSFPYWVNSINQLVATVW